jgi:hypothetical protein
MMTSTPTPWPDLLSQHFRDVNEAYGPNSQAVASAFVALSKTPWLEHVGEPWPEHVGAPLANNRVIVVRSWDEALTIFDDPLRYNVHGLLQGPCTRNDAVLARFPEREVWWQKAREDAKRYVALSGIPDTLPQESQDLLFEHLYELVSMLLVEIIAGPDAECTYFREQLTWFHAGHFPCGWKGD